MIEVPFFIGLQFLLFGIYFPSAANMFLITVLVE
ncbi:MAG: hypothetical protein RL711_1408 [Bacteroidota bacterium]|jgi:hypothetical protein